MLRWRRAYGRPAEIIDCFSQYERLVIRHRTRAALQAKKRRGERAGHVPYGWRGRSDGRTLERHEGEEATLAEIRRLRARGLALSSIAETLNEHGFATRHGRPWKESAVAQLLERHGDGITLRSA